MCIESECSGVVERTTEDKKWVNPQRQGIKYRKQQQPRVIRHQIELLDVDHPPHVEVVCLWKHTCCSTAQQSESQVEKVARFIMCELGIWRIWRIWQAWTSWGTRTQTHPANLEQNHSAKQADRAHIPFSIWPFIFFKYVFVMKWWLKISGNVSFFFFNFKFLDPDIESPVTMAET